MSAARLLMKDYLALSRYLRWPVQLITSTNRLGCRMAPHLLHQGGFAPKDGFGRLNPLKKSQLQTTE
jgi:hypothetical protein